MEDELVLFLLEFWTQGFQQVFDGLVARPARETFNKITWYVFSCFRLQVRPVPEEVRSSLHELQCRRRDRSRHQLAG